MRFEVTNALQNLDRKTPAYLQQEIFAHGDLKVRIEAVKVLKELDPNQKTCRVLRESLKLT